MTHESPSLRRVFQLDQLAETGLGPRCFVADHFLLWTTNDGLGGYAVWGQPSADDAQLFAACLWRVLERIELHPRLVVGDFRDLEKITSASFSVLVDHIRNNAQTIAALGFREALLHRGGPRGATIAGFYDVAPRLTRARSCGTVAAAAAWLERPDVARWLEEVARLKRERAAPPDWGERLRTLLALEPDIASLNEASRRLGTSSRSLQRHVRATGSTFRELRRTARLVAAKRLLAKGWKVTAVAAAIGFARVQHFSTWFRQQTGTMPSRWRDVVV